MIQSAKKEVFGHFLEFGLLDRVNIAYCDSTNNVFQLSAILPGLEGSFKKHNIAFLNDPESRKRGFWSFSGVWSVRST